ncbi:DUF4785 domain-containing protein [Pseudoalteromonas sp.]|uniref:DUF4785 domain-containing protein n=1 Tax=Pseudoalteromonas sp. TaxID=53249 RepID=UPI0035629959
MKKLTFVSLCCTLIYASNIFAEQIVYQYKQVQPHVAKHHNQSLDSNEYWITVSGQQLKRGVDLPLSAKNSFVRVAPKITHKSDEQPYIEPLDVRSLKLTSNDAQQNKETFAEHIFAQKEMDDAGFSDGSVALKVKSNKALQKFVLKTDQYLDDSSQYLVHVKEKESKAILNVIAANEMKSTSNLLALQSLQFSDPNIKVTNVSAKLKSPMKENVDVNVTSSGIRFTESLDYIGSIDGLYELELQVDAELSNMPIKRSIKVPFVNMKQTAKTSTNYTFTEINNLVKVTVPLTVSDPGKYSVQATLQGSNDGKQYFDIATVAMAKEFSMNGNFEIPFKVNTGYNFYQLSNVVLKDHSRLLVLETPPLPSSF